MRTSIFRGAAPPRRHAATPSGVEPEDLSNMVPNRSVSYCASHASPSVRFLLGCQVFVRLLLTLVSGLACTSEAAAQASRRLLILRDDRPATLAQLSERIDRLLEQAARDRGGFAIVEVSPVPFADIELAAGCDGDDAACLGQIASTLAAESF